MSRKAIILSAVPLIILSAYIAVLGLDIPFRDQWAVVLLAEKMEHGSVSFEDLLSQHNEHRPLFPRLLWLALVQGTRYNTNAELWLNLGIALVTFGIFVVYTAWVWRRQGIEVLDLLLPLLALLVFNLAQWESWLFGIQTIMFLGMMAVVTGFIVLTRFNNWPGLLGAALLGAMATFSMANAVLYWPIGLLMVALFSEPASRWPRFAAWLTISALIWGAFFHEWSPTPMASLSVLWKHPFIYIAWVLNFIGAPLLTYWYAWVFGILSFVWIVVVGIRAPKAYEWRLLAPYGAIVAFILASALAIAVGRASISLTSSVASRYLTMTVWYWASLLGLLPLVRLSDSWLRLLKISICLMLCVCMAGGGLLGYHWRYLRTLPVYRSVKYNQDVTDQDLEYVSGTSSAIARERLETLRQHGWSAYRK